MKYAFELPDGFLLKGLHHLRSDKGADIWWAYVQTAKPEYGKYHHFQGAQGFSLEEALASAHRNLVKDLAGRANSFNIPAKVPSALAGIKIDLSSITGKKLNEQR